MLFLNEVTEFNTFCPVIVVLILGLFCPVTSSGSHIIQMFQIKKIYLKY